MYLARGRFDLTEFGRDLAAWWFSYGTWILDITHTWVISVVDCVLIRVVVDSVRLAAFG